jgi:hypothetical protein
MTKRVNTDDIDEQFLLSTVRTGRGIKENIPESVPATPSTVEEKPEPEKEPEPEPVSPEISKEETKRKRTNKPDYESLFIKESNITARLGKTVYIRKEFHDRILKITQIIGDNEVSLFSYIDNIIAHHFESFKDDITQSYNRKNSNNIF